MAVALATDAAINATIVRRIFEPNIKLPNATSKIAINIFNQTLVTDWLLMTLFIDYPKKPCFYCFNKAGAVIMCGVLKFKCTFMITFMEIL